MLEPIQVSDTVRVPGTAMQVKAVRSGARAART